MRSLSEQTTGTYPARGVKHANKLDDFAHTRYNVQIKLHSVQATYCWYLSTVYRLRGDRELLHKRIACDDLVFQLLLHLLKIPVHRHISTRIDECTSKINIKIAYRPLR